MSKKLSATIFAHNGAVTAIAFAGEPLNYQGAAVVSVEADSQEELADAILAQAPSGVGSVWPPVKPEGKPAKAKADKASA